MPTQAFNLLITIFIVLLVLLPAMSWVAGKVYRDLSARLWFGAIALDAVVVLLLAFKSTIGEDLAEVLAHALVVFIYLLFCTSLHLEIWGKELERQYIYLSTVLFTLTYAALIDIDQTKYYSAIVLNIIYVLLSSYLIFLTLRLALKERNSHLIYVALGWVSGISGYVWRLIETVETGQRVLIFSFTPVSNWVIISNLITILLISLGYLAYLQDKLVGSKVALVKEATDANLRRELAERHAIELDGLIKQRDHLVMTSSRFQAAGALSFFNSAIVHEISQPLTSLTLCLQHLETRCQKDPSLHDLVMRANMMGAGVIRIVNTLRRLIRNGSIETHRFCILKALQDIFPVIQTECADKGIRLKIDVGKGASQVEADPTLVQRVMLNLAANAIEAVASVEDPCIRIQTDLRNREGKDIVVLSVSDNGIGMTDDQLNHLFRPFASNKLDGIGIGLALSQMLIMRWGGQLTAHNNTGSDARGMTFEICLPVCSA